MSAQPARPIYAEQLPAGLQTISNIVAVSSCKVGLVGGFSSSYIGLVISSYLPWFGCFLAIFFPHTLPSFMLIKDFVVSKWVK